MQPSHNAKNKTIILASNSPRRKELLRQIGLDFRVDPADVDERILPGESPEEYAVRVALDKARVAAARAGTGIVIAADTIVVLDDKILGKPADTGDAERMLMMLSGNEHRVITGLVVMDAATGKVLTRTSITRVWFRKLAPLEITSYVASGEPLDKAGAYGIQECGALLVDKIDGCYCNVVGLPLSLLAEMLRDFGFEVF
ncbi:MAG: Maf family protein [Nitrospirae bacterium]|nr:Maf family protein [Nitrospirota bacterium]